MPPRRASTRRSTASAARSPPSPSVPAPAPVTQPPSITAVDTEQFNQLIQHVRGLTEAVQAVLHQQVPVPARPARDSPKSDDPVQERPAWAARPPIPGLERRRRESPRSDHGSTKGEASRPSHQKALEIRDREDLLGQRLSEMNRRIEELRPPSRGDDVCADPPFSQKIMQEPVPPTFELPQLESYDGTSDPVDHLGAFRAMMLLHGASDAVLCRAFPSTLKGAARNWYSALKPNTIFSFDQMSSRFAAHFISSRRPSRGSDSLMSVKQKQGESIRTYVTRFNAAALEVRDLDQSVAMAALKGGLQKNNLLFSLEKKYPRDFADLLARAERYARAEEAFKLKDEELVRKDRLADEEELGEARLHSQTPYESRRARTPRTRPDKEARRSPPPGRFRRYAPLNAPRTQILTEVKHQLPRPEGLRSPPNKRDRNKYCLYHHDHGHDTEGCIQLRDEIEELVRTGRLGKFLRYRPEAEKDRLRALP